MSLTAVYMDDHRTDVYDDQGRFVFQYSRRHDGATASGNTVLIDASESEGYMEQIVFDDDGHVVRVMTLNPRPRR